MRINAIDRFSSDLLNGKLEPAGFQRRGNAWYKLVPDVILSAEVMNIRQNTFDFRFGITPFVCCTNRDVPLSLLQPGAVYNRTHPDEVKRFYCELYDTAPSSNPRFFYSIDSTVKALKDAHKYSVLLDYWTDVFDTVAAPYLLKVTDLPSAVEAVGAYMAYRGEDASPGEKKYYPGFMPAFMKLGSIDEAMRCGEPFISVKVADSGPEYIDAQVKKAIETNDYYSVFLWYHLMKTNDIIKMQSVLTSIETDAKDWIQNVLQLTIL